MSTLHHQEHPKLKIAYCIPSCFNSGGMERVLTLKANYLAEKLNYEVYILTTGQKGRMPFWNLSPAVKLIDLAVNYNDLEGKGLFQKIVKGIGKRKQHKKRLKQVLFHIKVDIVVSMFTHELPFLYKIKDGSAKVLELHFSKLFRSLHNKYNHAGLVTRLIGEFLNYRDFRSAKAYDKFVVLTNEDKLAWKSFQNIEVIPNPIYFSGDMQAYVRKKQVVAVGRLCPQKGFDMLIHIWNQINPQIRNSWSLCIYGSGPDKESLQRQINTMGLQNEIGIYPPTKDIVSVFRQSSIFCFTSRYEGFGMALAEAMYCGMSCVSFNCPCGPSDIIEDGFSGYLIDSFDCLKFANSVESLMIDEEKRLSISENGFSSAHAMFNIDFVMSRWNKLFNTLKNE